MNREPRTKDEGPRTKDEMTSFFISILMNRAALRLGQVADHPVRTQAAKPAYDLLAANVKEPIW